MNTTLRNRIQSLATLIATLLACAACAAPRAVPDFSQRTVPPILAAQGALSPAADEALLRERLGPHADNPLVLRLIHAFRAQARAPLIDGNRVQLLIDGPRTLEAIRRAVLDAQHHVHIETYIFSDDEVGRELRDLLVERQAAGVQVRLLYDGIGSLTTPSTFFEVMRDAGVEVLQFRPPDPVRTPLAWKVHNRDHRKIVIVDGRMAFTGGINFSSTYASSSSIRPGPEEGRESAWRDTHVRIHGPAVAQFQALFLRTWTRLGGEIEDSASYYPAIEPRGAELVAAVASEGGEHDEMAIYATFQAVIRHASRRLWITQAYFAPNEPMRQALIDAAQRGADVRLVVPGFTDSALIFYASRASYEELLEGGVRIYEQNHALLHAKTLVVDGAVSAIGSANFDMRSFLHNNEINAFVVGASFARKVERLFERDLENTTELTLETWRSRSTLDKLKELASSLFSYWL